MIRKKNILLLVLISAVTITAGCIPKLELFSAVKDNGNKVKVKKTGSIAVICPVRNMVNEVLAQRITEGLQVKSLFKVLSPAQIRSRVPGYPKNIIDFKLDGSKKYLTPYLSRGSKNSLNEIQGKLGVDYILVIWIENITKTMYSSSFADNMDMPVYARFIEYPSGKVIAYSTFSWVAKKSMFADDDRVVDNMLNGLAMRMVFKVTKATGSYKKI